MKKLLIPMGVLLILAFILAGCGGSPSTTPPASSTPGTTAPTTTATTAPTTTAKPSTTTPATTTPTTSATTTKPTSATPTPSKYGGTLRIAGAAGPNIFGAIWENSLSPITTQQIAIDTLIKEQVDGSFKPGLATAWEVKADQDNPSITFTLRKGVKFSDGTDFNAKAVKFNWDKWIESKMAIGTTQFWKSIDIVDDFTIRVNLTAWRNYMLRAFGDSTGMAVSPTAFEKNGIEWLRTNMVATGPFTQTAFTRDVSMTYEKNPGYWNTGKPYLDKITVSYVVDNLTRSALLKSGGAEMMDCNNENKVAYDLKNAGFNILVQPGSGFFSLVPDSLNPGSPWSNIKVRLAAEYAINKEALWTAFGFGYDSPAYQYSPVSSAAYDPTLAPRKYDVAKAKQLMAEAGFPNGFKTNMVVATNASRDAATAMQAYLAAIGIQCELQFPQQAAWMQQVTGTWTNGVQFMTQSYWPNINAVWNLMVSEPPNWFKSLKHPDGWKDALFASFGTKEMDPVAMKKLEKMLYDDETFIPLSYHLGTYAASPKLMDTGYGTRGMWTWWNPEDTWLSK